MFENDEGIRSQNQVQGQAPDGSLKNVRTNENGELLVAMNGGGDTGKEEKVLASGVVTLGTTALSISVNAKVTDIQVANYSEEANVTMTIGTKSIVIAPNIAEDIPVNEQVTNLSLVSTAADTKFYYVVKGVIAND